MKGGFVYNKTKSHRRGIGRGKNNSKKNKRKKTRSKKITQKKSAQCVFELRKCAGLGSSASKSYSDEPSLNEKLARRNPECLKKFKLCQGLKSNEKTPQSPRFYHEHRFRKNKS